MIKFQDLNYQNKFVGKNILKSFKKIMKSNQYIGGNNLDEFQRKFAILNSSKYCLGVANGTDALEISLQACNFKKNSEIIVPANTWISTAEAVIRNNYKLVLVDIDPETLLIDYEDLKRKITKNTRCIIAVHLYGMACNMEIIKKIIKDKNIKLIEDCAQAVLSKYKNKNVGNFGISGCFSFFPGKNLGAFGDAGCITTNDKNFFLLCKKIANHGGLKKHEHDVLGRNSRLDNIQAAVLNEKMKFLKNWIIRRKKNAILYNKLLKNVSEIKLPQLKDSNKNFSTFHQYVIRVDSKKRNLLREHLYKYNIPTAIHYPNPIHKHKVFSKIKFKNLNKSSKLSNEIISLPVGEHLGDKEIKSISKKIREFF